MRKGNGWAFLSFLCFWGCAPVPERVSILPASAPPPPVAARTSAGAGSPITARAQIEGSPARAVFVGSGSGQAELAQAAARQNQERVLAETVADLKKSYTAAVLAGYKLEANNLKSKYRERLAKLYDTVRARFEQHAEAVGPLWVRFSFLAGFPERPGKRAQAPSNFLTAGEAAEADRVRAKIASLDAEFRREIGAQMESARQGLRLEESDLEAKKVVDLDAAERRANTDAAAAASDVLKSFEQSVVSAFETLPEISAAAAEVAATRPAPQRVPPRVNAGGWKDDDRSAALRRLFAEAKGYLLSEPGPGVRDATSEFIEWSRTWDGR